MLYQIENRSDSMAYFNAYSLTTLPHIHPHLEFIYMQEGSSIAVVDDKKFLIETGDIFLSFPNQIHFYQPDSALYCQVLIFAPDLFSDLKECFKTQVPVSPIIKKHLLPSDTCSILEKIQKKIYSDSSFELITAKGYLMALLGNILPLMELVDAPTHHDSLKNLLAYCSENYTEPITLDSLAAALHLNKYYVSHLFKERMNMGFTDFVNNLRIEHACNLLSQDTNITDVAFSSGFSSIRTFNRVFSQNIGMTPRDYLKSKRKMY